VSIELLAIPAIAVVAIALIVVAGRSSDGGGRGGAGRVDAVDDVGLHVGDTVADWASIFEVAVVTRRELGGSWFGFEVRSETAGELVVDGADGLVEPLLAETHRLPGFNHAAVGDVLGRRRGREVCYRR